ncbi:MAG: hypothetical protein ACKO0U_03695 [Gammaproteobacteria bacterium]
MIRVRKRQPRRKPGDLLPEGVRGRREVIHQLTGSQRFAPGVYHERRVQRDRRRPLLRQLLQGNVRALTRSPGRRQTDGYELPFTGRELWIGLAVSVAVVSSWRWFGSAG